MGQATMPVPGEQVLAEAVGHTERIFAMCAPWSLATMKRRLRAGLLEAYDRDAAVSAEYQKEAFRGPAFAEGVRSYQQERDPVFDSVGHDPAPSTP